VVCVFLVIYNSLSNKIDTEIYKVSGKVRNKETLRIKACMRGKTTDEMRGGYCMGGRL